MTMEGKKRKKLGLSLKSSKKFAVEKTSGHSIHDKHDQMADTVSKSVCRERLGFKRTSGRDVDSKDILDSRLNVVLIDEREDGLLEQQVSIHLEESMAYMDCSLQKEIEKEDVKTGTVCKEDDGNDSSLLVNLFPKCDNWKELEDLPATKTPAMHEDKNKSDTTTSDAFENSNNNNEVKGCRISCGSLQQNDIAEYLPLIDLPKPCMVCYTRKLPSLITLKILEQHACGDKVKTKDAPGCSLLIRDKTVNNYLDTNLSVVKQYHREQTSRDGSVTVGGIDDSELVSAFEDDKWFNGLIAETGHDKLQDSRHEKHDVLKEGGKFITEEKRVNSNFQQHKQLFVKQEKNVQKNIVISQNYSNLSDNFEKRNRPRKNERLSKHQRITEFSKDCASPEVFVILDKGDDEYCVEKEDKDQSSSEQKASSFNRDKLPPNAKKLSYEDKFTLQARGGLLSSATSQNYERSRCKVVNHSMASKRFGASTDSEKVFPSAQLNWTRKAIPNIGHQAKSQYRTSSLSSDVSRPIENKTGISNKNCSINSKIFGTSSNISSTLNRSNNSRLNFDVGQSKLHGQCQSNNALQTKGFVTSGKFLTKNQEITNITGAKSLEFNSPNAMSTTQNSWQQGQRKPSGSAVIKETLKCCPMCQYKFSTWAKLEEIDRHIASCIGDDEAILGDEDDW